MVVTSNDDVCADDVLTVISALFNPKEKSCSIPHLIRFILLGNGDGKEGETTCRDALLLCFLPPPPQQKVTARFHARCLRGLRSRQICNSLDKYLYILL